MGDSIISRITDTKKEAKWNIVDVHGDDGLLHRGCIVGVAPGGLIIDFDSKVQEVPYGKMYRSRQRTFFSDNEKRPASEYRGCLVEVLLRVEPEMPYKWYPGTLLFGDSVTDHHFGLVKVYFPDATTCLAVPGNRFRTASTEAVLKRSVIMEGKLVDRSSVSKLPERPNIYTMDDWDPSIRIFDHRGIPTGFTGRLMYDKNDLNKCVLRGRQRWLVVADIGDGVLYVKNCVASGAAQQRRDPQIGRLWRQLHKYARFIGFLAAEMFRASCILLENYLKIDVYDWTEITIQNLSHNLLSNIFGCLDSPDQVPVGPVCKEWHNALISEPGRRVVRYTFSRNEDKTYRGEYELADCLLKCWNDDTQVIAIRGDGKSPMSQIGQYIRDIMEEKHHNAVAKLLLYNHHVHVENHRNGDADDFVDDLRRTLSPLASVCSVLILKDVSMFRPSQIIPIVVHFKWASVSAGQLEPDQRMNLWERLDKSCPKSDNSHSSTLAVWLRNFNDLERRKIFKHYRPTDRDNIAKILTFIQGNDPRHVHYRLQKWEPDELVTLDLGKLTRLTAYALHAALQHDSMKIEVCW